MDSKTLVMKAVNFEKPYRIPLWNTYFFPEFVEKWKPYMGFETDNPITPSDYYGYDVAIVIGNESFFPSRYRLLSDDGRYKIYEDNWGRTVKVSDDAYFIHALDSVLKDLKDVEKLEFESAKSEVRWKGFDEHIKALKSQGKCMFSKIGGIYIRSHHLWPEENLLADMALEEELCGLLFDKITDHFTDMALETLRRSDTWDTGLWVYDDMAGTHSMMFSPALFEKYFLPRYKRMIDTLRKAGCKHFYFHSDGNILPCLDLLLEAGFEGFNPLEYRSGLDIVALRKKYGKKMVFFGGLCNTEILPRGDLKEIEAHIKPMLEIASEGGVILGTHTIAVDVPPRALDFAMNLIKEYVP